MLERPYILSFSRKTDGPRYYSEWFDASWKRGFAEARNSFGGPIRAELGRQNVAALLGWTRDARPFARCLELLRSEGVPTAWQVTLTAYGRDLEPGRPKDDVGAFLWLRERLPDSSAIEWRYDPIVVCDRYPESFHLEAFARLAGALRGATRICNTSIVEAFRKTVRRLGDVSVAYRPNERLEEANAKGCARGLPARPGIRRGAREDRRARADRAARLREPGARARAFALLFAGNVPGLRGRVVRALEREQGIAVPAGVQVREERRHRYGRHLRRGMCVLLRGELRRRGHRKSSAPRSSRPHDASRQHELISVNRVP